MIEERTKLALENIKDNSIYFGHPVSEYNTELESLLIDILSMEFPHATIYNPNNDDDQTNYQLWRSTFDNGMKYYFDVILPRMKSGVFLPFSDGMFGAGVCGVADFIRDNGKEIFTINNRGLVRKINSISPSSKLTIEETRARIYPKD